MATDLRQASVAAGSSIALPPSFTTTGRSSVRSHPQNGGGERFGGRNGRRTSASTRQSGQCRKNTWYAEATEPSTAASRAGTNISMRVIAAVETDRYSINHGHGAQTAARRSPGRVHNHMGYSHAAHRIWLSRSASPRLPWPG